MLIYEDVIGVDEVGRGPLYGDVVACAVYVKSIEDEIFNEINDSKKISEKKRNEIYERLKNNENVVYSIGRATSKEIDELNILNASLLAMKRAVEGLNIKDKLVLVDGNQEIKGCEVNQKTLIKGDSKSLSIALASIFAKVTRDREMIEEDKLFPEYSFKDHKGYPTKKHYEAIKKYGILDKHRKTFLKKILEV